MAMGGNARRISVYDPQSGGKKIPEAIKLRITQTDW
jgi:hypothetical protein